MESWFIAVICWVIASIGFLHLFLNSGVWIDMGKVLLWFLMGFAYVPSRSVEE